MNPLLPEQQKQIDSWASQRDFILLDISIKREESAKLIERNKELASSNTEIADKIQQSEGRLIELSKKETEMAGFTTIENSELKTEKSKLEEEVYRLKISESHLILRKEELNADIEAITKIHESVFKHVGVIEQIVGETVKINSQNAREIKNILVEAGNELIKIIEVAEKNVEVTNRAIVEIPQIILDLHKSVLERRIINKRKII